MAGGGLRQIDLSAENSLNREVEVAEIHELITKLDVDIAWYRGTKGSIVLIRHVNNDRVRSNGDWCCYSFEVFAAKYVDQCLACRCLGSDDIDTTGEDFSACKRASAGVDE